MNLFKLIYIFCLVINIVLCEELDYEKFISTMVEVNGKVRPLYLLYQNNNITGFFIESKYWTDDDIQGYGGPINLQIYFSLDGKIQKIKVIEQYETETYANEVFTEKFLSQFYNKDNTAKFILGKDIQGISGATISCSAVNEIIQQCVNNVGSYLQKGKIKQKIRISKIEVFKVLVTFLLFTVATIGYISKIKILRYFVMVFSIIFFGIVYKGGLSIGHVNSLIHSHLIATHNLVIIFILGTTVFVTIIFGRLYCGWLCPFGAVVEILFDIKKFLETMYRKTLGKEVEVFFVEDNTIVKFLRTYEKYYRYTKYLLVCAVFLLPSLIVLEPFQYMFMFYKSKLWYVVYTVVIVLLCIIFVRLWCRYLCPLGAVLALVSNFSLFRLKINSKDCLGCEICLNVCPTNAIVKKNSELKLLHTECILCNKCLHVCGPKCITRKFSLQK